MKNILTGQIDHLNFEKRKIIRTTRAICATRSTVAKLLIHSHIITNIRATYSLNETLIIPLGECYWIKLAPKVEYFGIN
jgi:hypothetical protein